ncbi:hypothetical protein F4805DRAFT_85793 [Annulohypoxylon moriforme]|nr:hypothetical protein F4805DRAFT_85793 [Annulohypoxylon moriforme]
MCYYFIRVYNCGHYKKTLTSPCKDAKKNQVPCPGGNQSASTAAAWCPWPGCDKKAGICREGPR